MKFIIVHGSKTGKEIYINPEHIVAMARETGLSETSVFLRHEHIERLLVKETPNEIVDLSGAGLRYGDDQ